MAHLVVDEFVVWGSVALEIHLTLKLALVFGPLHFGLELFVVALLEIQNRLKLRSKSLLPFGYLLLSKPVQVVLYVLEVAVELILVSLLDDLLKKLQALQRAFDVLLAARGQHLVRQGEVALHQNAHDLNLVLDVGLLNHLFDFLARNSSYDFFSSYVLLLEELLNLLRRTLAILLPVLALEDSPSALNHLAVPRFYPLLNGHALIEPCELVGPDFVFGELFQSLSDAWGNDHVRIYALALTFVNLYGAGVLVFEVLVIFVLQTVFLLINDLNVLQQVEDPVHVFYQNVVARDDHLLFLFFRITQLLFLRVFCSGLNSINFCRRATIYKVQGLSSRFYFFGLLWRWLSCFQISLV